jgi:transposase-like protein
MMVSLGMASRKKAKNSKGRRYSAEEKATIIGHVEKINASKGRGGLTAASKKFGISMLTVSNWMNKAPATKTRGAGKSRSVNGALAKLASLHSRIEAKEKEVAKLRQEFDVLKRSL